MSGARISERRFLGCQAAEAETLDADRDIEGTTCAIPRPLTAPSVNRVSRHTPHPGQVPACRFERWDRLTVQALADALVVHADPLGLELERAHGPDGVRPDPRAPTADEDGREEVGTRRQTAPQ